MQKFSVNSSQFLEIMTKSGKLRTKLKW